MTGPCDHGRGHDGNRTSTLACRELTRYIVIYVLSKQLDHDDHQLYHSLNVSYAGVNISGLVQCWFWRELSQEVTRVSKCFPFDILIDTLTSDTIYRSNLKYRFSIYIAYRYATLVPNELINHFDLPSLLQLSRGQFFCDHRSWSNLVGMYLGSRSLPISFMGNLVWNLFMGRERGYSQNLGVLIVLVWYHSVNLDMCLAPRLIPHNVWPLISCI